MTTSRRAEPLASRLLRGAVGGVLAGMVFAAVTMWFTQSTAGKADMLLRMISTIVKGDQAMAAAASSTGSPNWPRRPRAGAGMTAGAGRIVVERRVEAPPETVFTFFSEPERWLQWQGVEADLDPRPGGTFRMNVRGDGRASGRFLEVEPPRRIVFTWGWELEGSPLPPGSSVVEVELIPADGGTLIRLTHRNLPPDELATHRAGWSHYLDRLATRAGGGDPGPDPWRLG